MLDRMLLGRDVREPSIPAISFELPTCSKGPLTLDHVPRPTGFDNSDEPLETQISSQSYRIIKVNIEILSIWECVLADITQPSSEIDTPIWRHDSRRSAIMTKIMDFESSGAANYFSWMLLTVATECHRGLHRYMSTGLATHVIQGPYLRGYFLAWIYFQLVYCVIHCCLCVNLI